MKADRTVDISLVVLLVLVLIAGIALLNAHERRTITAASEHLTTMLTLRESVLQSYFESLRSEVMLWSSRDVVIDILTLLNRAAEDPEELETIGEMRAEDLASAEQRQEDASLDDRVRAFAAHHDYYDVFFVSPEGDVLYTVAREADYGTNLIDGPYADTGLGRLFQTLMTSGDDIVAMEDFSRYPPSDDQPAAFLGARVVKDGETIGVYAIQIPEEPINHIMQFSAGMGETGETYLVGEDGLMRSTSRFFRESTVLSSEVNATTVGKALADQVGIEIVEDYRGIPVFSAYRLFEFEGIRWAMLGEQDVAEIREPVDRARLWLAGGFVLLCLIVLLLRFMLVRIVLPSSIAALLGLSFVATESQADN